MFKPWKIVGYAGQHDEAGAQIVDQDGKPVLHTAGLEGGNWEAYHRRNNLAAAAPQLHNLLSDVLDNPLVVADPRWVKKANEVLDNSKKGY